MTTIDELKKVMRYSMYIGVIVLIMANLLRIEPSVSYFVSDWFWDILIQSGFATIFVCFPMYIVILLTEGKK